MGLQKCPTSLMGLQESGDERIEVKEKEFVDADETRYQVDQHDLDLEPFVRRFQLLEQLLGKTCVQS